ncbi:Indoleamine 2,3-dioxygenase [Xylariomycetidae sp. FL2044]|nr:Indoleamine 2,3-dioxygenase [Xylariomycetidae sp. FL2044]
MSPHALSASTLAGDATLISWLLKKHEVTVNGFLPSEEPLKRLLDPYYAPWEDLVGNLPGLLGSGSLRSRVESLSVLCTEKLTTQAEWRRAYTILAFLTHGYVWGGRQPAERLPAAISIPFLEISRRLELPPVLSYAASNLWNFASSNSDYTDIDHLRPLHTFTGTDDESWFLMISVAMEAQAGYIIPVMLEALDAIKVRDYATIAMALEELANCIEKVGALLERMYERCRPDVFYHQVRPYLAGSKNMAAAGLPRGVFYPEDDDGNGNWRELRGGSNGQSSMIQFFDVVLGIIHGHDGDGQSHSVGDSTASARASEWPTFYEEIRDYMPGQHRRFLADLSRMGSIQELALQVGSTPEQDQFRMSYTRATETLGRFREKHIQIVTRYIILPSRKAQQSQAARHKKLSASSIKASGRSGLAEEASELKGTGGTTLIPFLKQGRDETVAAGALT